NRSRERLGGSEAIGLAHRSQPGRHLRWLVQRLERQRAAIAKQVVQLEDGYATVARRDRGFHGAPVRAHCSNVGGTFTTATGRPPTDANVGGPFPTTAGRPPTGSNVGSTFPTTTRRS